MGAEVSVQSVGACRCPEVKRMEWGHEEWVKEPKQSCRGVVTLQIRGCGQEGASSPGPGRCTCDPGWVPALGGDGTWRGCRGGPGLKAVGGQLDQMGVQGEEGRAWGQDAFQGEQRTCMWGEEVGAGMAGQAGVTELLQFHTHSQKLSPEAGEELRSPVRKQVGVSRRGVWLGAEGEGQGCSGA